MDKKHAQESVGLDLTDEELMQITGGCDDFKVIDPPIEIIVKRPIGIKYGVGIITPAYSVPVKLI